MNNRYLLADHIAKGIYNIEYKIKLLLLLLLHSHIWLWFGRRLCISCVVCLCNESIADSHFPCRHHFILETTFALNEFRFQFHSIVLFFPSLSRCTGWEVAFFRHFSNTSHTTSTTKTDTDTHTHTQTNTNHRYWWSILTMTATMKDINASAKE